MLQSPEDFTSTKAGPGTTLVPVYVSKAIGPDLSTQGRYRPGARVGTATCTLARIVSSAGFGS